MGGAVVAVLIVLAATLLPLLLQIRRTAAAFEQVALKVHRELDPTIHETQGLVRDVSSLARRLDTDMKVVSRIVEDVSDTTGYARDLASLVKNEVERPILGLLSTIRGIRKGLDAFRGFRKKARAPRNPFRHAARAREESREPAG